jgi:hypothetical protein
MREDSVFLEPDVLGVVRNSILPIESGDWDPDDILPCLRLLHVSFHLLRKLLPGEFEDERFELQFGCYTKHVSHLELLRDKLLDSISRAAIIPSENISEQIILSSAQSFHTFPATTIAFAQEHVSA